MKLFPTQDKKIRKNLNLLQENLNLLLYFIINIIFYSSLASPSEGVHILG